MLDKKLLMQIFKVGSRSGSETKMIKFIINFLEENNIPYTEDSYGNIVRIHNHKKPILNAHMDTVQDEIDESLTRFVKIRKGVLSSYGVLGGDDKCGIYIILHLLRENPDEYNFIFSVCEEIGGGNGIQKIVKDFEKGIEKCPYFLTLDRKGDDDILCTNNDYGTKKFEDDLVKISNDGKFGYSPGTGTFSDANSLSNYISGANLSVGYYNAHKKNEFVILRDLENALRFVDKITKTIKTSYDKPVKTYGGYYGGYYSGYDYDYGYDYDIGHSSQCYITKKTSNVKYISSIGRYLSPEGARELLLELDREGFLNPNPNDTLDEFSDEDFEELLNEF